MGVRLFTEDFLNPSRDYSPWIVGSDVNNPQYLHNPPTSNNSSSSVKFKLFTSYISFKYWVSSESGRDYLRVYIDGASVVGTSGSPSAWVTYEKTYPLPLEIEVEFRYSKDSSYNSGHDKGFITDLVYSIPYNEGYLLKDGEDIKYWDTTNLIWVSTGESLFSKELVEQYGVRAFPNSLKGIISTNPTLLYWSEEEQIDYPVARYCRYKAIPKNQIIKQTNDFNIISSVKGVDISASSPGTSYIRFAMSKDGGASWQKCKGSSWTNVDINNIEEFGNGGNSAEEIVAITIEDWEKYLQGNTLIRFAYLLGTELSIDIPKLGMLRVWYN